MSLSHDLWLIRKSIKFRFQCTFLFWPWNAWVGAYAKTSFCVKVVIVHESHNQFRRLTYLSTAFDHLYTTIVPKRLYNISNLRKRAFSYFEIAVRCDKFFLTHFRWLNQLDFTTSRIGRFQKSRFAKKISKNEYRSTVL